MIKVRFVNNRKGFIWLTSEQAYCVEERLYKESGLDLDTYLSLIDPDYIVWYQFYNQNDTSITFTILW